jgi:hypothetical protein
MRNRTKIRVSSEATLNLGIRRRLDMELIGYAPGEKAKVDCVHKIRRGRGNNSTTHPCRE